MLLRQWNRPESGYVTYRRWGRLEDFIEGRSAEGEDVVVVEGRSLKTGSSVEAGRGRMAEAWAAVKFHVGVEESIHQCSLRWVDSSKAARQCWQWG